MFAEALSALAINSTDIPLQKYQEIIAKQPTYKIEKSKDTYINLSKNLKMEINNFFLALIDFNAKFIPLHKEVFINNFDKWEIEEGQSTLSLVNQTINTKKKLNVKYIRLRRLVRGHTSLTTKIDELISFNEDIIKFTNHYLIRAKEADEASKFINDFISDNQEVLKALA
jgi:hypothetical protein